MSGPVRVWSVSPTIQFRHSRFLVSTRSGGFGWDPFGHPVSDRLDTTPVDRGNPSHPGSQEVGSSLVGCKCH